MDNIRATIDTLFSQINSTSILNAYFNIQNNADMLGVSEDMFCQKFMVENKCYTQDQVRELFRLLQSEWIQKPRNSFVTGTKCNLFYILCHYTKEVLSEDDEQPVCRYNQLLRWRMLTYKLGEDIFTTSFLAFSDAQTFLPKRDLFLWPSVIRQDNPSIEHVLEKGVTDLHFHFWGSSLNYELNWLSLMNNITSRSHEFTQLRNCLSYKTSTVDKEKWDSFYLTTIKACAIRFYLYLLLTEYKGAGVLKDIKESLNTILKTENETPGAYVSEYRSLLQSYIHIIKRENALSAPVTDDVRCLDYAIPLLKWRQKESDLSVTLLSGERWLMYNLFYRIYRNESSLEEQFLFYIYLLQKTQLRKELIQLNERKGFRNFSDYEKRKSLFIENYAAYSRVMPKVIIDTAFSSGYLKYLECRITPKDDSVQLYRTIKEIDDSVVKNKSRKLLKKFFYILHFIKEADKENFSDVYCNYRHYRLRRKIKEQGKATLKALKDYPDLRKRIIGIDAANTELYCRPEVFGPIYRYMNRFLGYDNTGTLDHSLNFTYHVGEDFWDITDGLRAIDEAILFLNMGANDRLGHALALGTDVKQYYKFRNNRVVMSKQHLLDNAAWLLCKARDLKINLSANVIQILEEQFFQLYDEIYLYDCSEYSECNSLLELEGRNVYTYYQSWMLRGDDPVYYRIPSKKPEDRIPYTLWELTAYNECNDRIINARKRESVRDLYHRYHYDAHVRRIGSEKHEMVIQPEIIELIEKVQHRMCHEIASLHLGIEANLTSNQFIGSMNKYIQHPIVKLNQMGLKWNDTETTCPQMSVSINTDDRGIFDTSIEQEYALLALALEKEIDGNQERRYQPRYVYQWLDNIREMGFEQKFKKDDRKRESCSKSWSRCSMRKRPK